MKSRIFGLLFALVGGLPVAAQAAFIFTTNLSGPAEQPPNNSPATGTATVTWDDVAHTMRVEATFTGLQDVTTASHIHVINGPGDANTADTAGPVATTIPSFVGFPLGVTSGTFDQTYDMTLDASYRGQFITDAGGTTSLAEAALFAALLDGRAYLNIHTVAFPGGEIRGFLVAPAAVPEPGSLALLALGLAGLALVKRRVGPSEQGARACSAGK